ncbi:hypothetical protein SAMN06297387_10223 [Streptomyces zhaozhouensis]|uniref:Uncharacterized protein n=1 Tax=Streptomyces zhaozhouensis TaxID=1300267 RepID=A0A286DN38_9ACTN|nr:hypothetical protein SAMN06297387_10223 [Streptomyces zhaozhouensis]
MVIFEDNGDLSYPLADHDGTGQIAVDARSLAMEQRRTPPFGAIRGPTPDDWPGTRGSVGGTSDTSTGLTHLGAATELVTLGANSPNGTRPRAASRSPSTSSRPHSPTRTCRRCSPPASWASRRADTPRRPPHLPATPGGAAPAPRSRPGRAASRLGESVGQSRSTAGVPANAPEWRPTASMRRVAVASWAASPSNAEIRSTAGARAAVPSLAVRW